MSETVASNQWWKAPSVSQPEPGIVEIDFRDAVVRTRDGAVWSYFDKQRQVYLKPSDDPEEWLVVSSSGELTGHRWRGSIMFDGIQLIIQQAKNLVIRLYRLDGLIETQFRMARVSETPGARTTVYYNRAEVREDLPTRTRTLEAGGKKFVRNAAQTLYRQDAAGELEEVPESEEGLALYSPDITNPAIEPFRQFLQSWQQLQPLDGKLYFAGSPPGIAEYEPGRVFRASVADKPENFREVVAHDFEDGTVLFEYFGRLDGMPFTGHEVVTYDGCILVRYAEYDQPRDLEIVDDRDVHRSIKGVLSVEMDFDPDTQQYRTSIIDSEGNTHRFPDVRI